MVEWVLSLEPDAPQASAEFAEGLAQLRMLAGPGAHWVFADAACAGDFPAALAHLLLQTEHRPGTERVLVLAHVQLQFTHDMLERMAAAVHHGPADGTVDAALCWGSARVPAGFAPDYCTVRGLERYARAMALAVPAEYGSWNALALPAGCQVAVATLGALRTLVQGGKLRTAWLPGCFAHDFAHYHQGQRPEVLPWVPHGAHRVLDVGGGEGHFLALLRAERGCETHLSEYSAAVCALAAPKVDFVWPGDFLALDSAAVAQRAGAMPGPGVFDCITFLDSLEHAADPGQWLDKAHGLLREGGCIVGSIPNVGHWSVVADLLEGRWDYCPVGIHCNTHLRFFTRRTVVDLLARHGFSVEAMEPTLVPTPTHWRSHWLATPGLETGLAELDAYAFLFRARKLGDG
ncbi:MAG: methyltransferase domain-containing protein [Burkholderiaceae bacterium]|nr:methyltransferase domain-containing protein [Burkholderiaceae bacterium]